MYVKGMRREFWLENQKERENSEDLYVGGMLILSDFKSRGWEVLGYNCLA
jgi:hypothetical protein